MNLEPRDEVVGEASAKVPLQLRKNGDEIWGLDMLCGINAEPRKPNSNHVREVRCNALLHVVFFGVEVDEAREPAGVEVQGVRPRVERPLAVEVRGAVHGSRELHA
jgi:hypothetical protein